MSKKTFISYSYIGKQFNTIYEGFGNLCEELPSYSPEEITLIEFYTLCCNQNEVRNGRFDTVSSTVLYFREIEE